MRFTGRVAIVTGAAQGIGRACCELLGAEGATIVAVDADQGRLDELSAVLANSGVPVTGLRVDALNEESVNAAIESTLAQLGRIDILVNGVGGSTVTGGSTTALEMMSLQEFEGVLRFNLSGTFLFSRAVIPAMKRQGSGNIVNVASIAARGTAFSNAAYSAAKAGVVALTTKLARELAPHGIHCNAVAPGLTMTERMQTALENVTQGEL